MEVVKKKILIFVDWFTPAFKAGGPIQSCKNLSFLLSSTYEVYLLTGDRDLGDDKPFEEVTLDQWIAFEKRIKVQYLSQSKQTYSNIKKIIQELNPKFLYLNSMFSKVFTIYPLLYIRRTNNLDLKCVLSPRGMLKLSAINSSGSRKKKLFLALFRLFNIHEKIIFHATNEEEASEVTSIFGEKTRVQIVSNVPKMPVSGIATIEKNSGYLKLVYLSRVHPIKNLILALEVLNQHKSAIAGQIEFTIVGNVENSEYWNNCKKLINSISNNVQFSIRSGVPNEEIVGILQQHHFFILPTHGENFGHAIFEAFAAGRPVMISDRTPWRSLEEQKIGWDLALDNKDKWFTAIQAAVNMNQEEYDVYSKLAKNYANTYLLESGIEEKYYKLFHEKIEDFTK